MFVLDFSYFGTNWLVHNDFGQKLKQNERQISSEALIMCTATIEED
jgi:hypothetical protein